MRSFDLTIVIDYKLDDFKMVLKRMYERVGYVMGNYYSLKD